MDGGTAAAHIGVIHEVVVHEGVVVVHLDAERCGDRGTEIAVIERVGGEQEHGAQTLAAAGEDETNGIVKSLGALGVGQGGQGLFDVLKHDSRVSSREDNVSFSRGR